MSRRSRSQRLFAYAMRVWTALVLAAVTSSSTLAWATPCCLHAEVPVVAQQDGCCAGEHADSDLTSADDPQAAEQDAERDAPSDPPGEPCSCPSDCLKCRAGLPSNVVPVAAGSALSILPNFVLLIFLPPVDSATDGPPHDVLHVPKPARVAS